ncbi:MAG: tRNA (adenosine(37)-N6)-threonylcarbamoyltransferase complex ATPase subunit type 1 TsaE [Desulfuromonadales bacterium]|nr:tRNA (adenosine(37)-N6)-threonylcarbamoyltransferase complex ATPase subunit type 1 TsaE [Desulfuromonadales bacterium]
MQQLILLTCSPDETEVLGQQLGSLVSAGIFIALCGELGGGKTCFTRGVVAGAAPQSSHLVASPTFAIMNEYPGITPIYHFDFYRFASCHEIAELGFEDYFQGHGICIAEWAEKLDELLPRERLEITFEHAGDDRRRITFTACGSVHETLLERVAGVVSPRKTLT